MGMVTSKSGKKIEVAETRQSQNMDPNQDQIKIRSEGRKSEHAFINSILQEEIANLKHSWFGGQRPIVGYKESVAMGDVNSAFV